MWLSKNEDNMSSGEEIVIVKEENEQKLEIERILENEHFILLFVFSANIYNLIAG